MSYLYPQAAALWAARGDVLEATLAGDVSLVTRVAGSNELDVSKTGIAELAPDGANRTVLLPPPGVALKGAELVVKHGDGANAITIESPSGTTVATLATAEAATVRCVNDPTDGYVWYNLGVGKAT